MSTSVASERRASGESPETATDRGEAPGILETLGALERGVTDLAALQLEIVRARLRRAVVRAALLAAVWIAVLFASCAAILACLQGLASLAAGWVGHPGLGDLLAGLFALALLAAGVAGAYRVDRGRRVARARARFEGE